MPKKLRKMLGDVNVPPAVALRELIDTQSKDTIRKWCLEYAETKILHKESIVNIQIFGKSKCFDTKKAERYFKERKIKFQLIDVAKYVMSKGEYRNVRSAVRDIYALIDEKSKEYEEQYIKHIADEYDIEERLLANPAMFKTPIVRNGKKSTIGYQPDVWKSWE